MGELSSVQLVKSWRNSSYEPLMRFSRNQIIGALLLLALLWMVILYRVLFSRA
jgi:hypothetical protein